MKSDLHKKLQHKGVEYLLNKGFWIRTMEMPSAVGVFDVWGISNSSEPKYETMAIEVKVSRNDYKSKSQKYKEFSAHYGNVANYCYILCPEYMVGEYNDSPKWGILWYSEKTGRLRLVRKAERFEMSELQKIGIMISLFHNRMNNPDKLLQFSIPPQKENEKE